MLSFFSWSGDRDGSVGPVSSTLAPTTDTSSGAIGSSSDASGALEVVVESKLDPSFLASRFLLVAPEGETKLSLSSASLKVSLRTFSSGNVLLSPPSASKSASCLRVIEGF